MSAPRSKHVMVVEDDSPIRSMLADLLHDAGYVVVEACDGAEALRQLRQHEPDLIVLDLMLPGVSGWQFLSRSREHLDRAGIPVVALSAIDGRTDYPSTLGVAAWFTKPLDVPKFLGAVEQLAGGSRTDVIDENPSRRAHVLLIEDDPPVRRMLTEHLSGMDYAVDAVEMIDQARGTIAIQPPDLILLDLMLPREDGWTFLRERKHDPQLASLPVLVISAAPQKRLLEAKELGADGFLSKPFDLDVLTALVRSFVR